MRLLKNKKEKFIVEMDEKEYAIALGNNNELYCTPCKIALEELAKFQEICKKYSINNSDELNAYLNRENIDKQLIEIMKGSKMIPQAANATVLYSNIRTENAAIREFEKLGYGLFPSTDTRVLNLMKVEPNKISIITINKSSETCEKYNNITKESLPFTIDEYTLVLRIFQQFNNI